MLLLPLDGAGAYVSRVVRCHRATCPPCTHHLYSSVRLVQIDTPEVFFGTECYGTQASATKKRLLPVGARVRLLSEPATDRVDDYGRLLRYVVRASDGVNVNVRLVAMGAAAPYFFRGSARDMRTG